MTASSSPTASPSRTATFLLRQPRQVQGYREPLQAAMGRAAGSAGDPGADLSHSLALTMLWIPPGRFWMGSPETEPERQDREGPQHLVQLQGFFMGQTPISQAQWREVATWAPQPGERWGRQLDPQPSFFQPRPNPNARSYGGGRFALLPAETNSDLRPVDNVSWHDAIEFCSRLSQRTGRNYTLPAEAQWEYACRAATTTPFHFGPTLSVALANYNGNFSYANGPKGTYRQQTTPVAMFSANAWGLHDMHGNVWEWCLDHWHDSYEGAPTDGRPWLNSPAPTNNATTKPGNDSSLDGTPRLLRGGSWLSSPRNCRSAYRFHDQPVNALYYVGFRVVCLPQDPSLNP
jgi:formylglycine-generating enzyme required for sulfatase activity